MASNNSTASNGNGATNVAMDFSNELLRVIVTTHGTGNIIISPLQLEALLTLLYLGSDGGTAEELQRVLELNRFASNAKMANHFATELQLSTDSAADTHMQLCSELLLPVEVEVSDEFRKIAQKYFHTTALQRDFSSIAKLRAQLDEDLAKAAAGYAWRINDALLSTITTPEAASTAIVLAAVHFQSKWFLPFSSYRTGLYDFQLSVAEAPAGSDVSQLAPPAAVSVPMLFDDDMFVKFAELRELDARAIELPYEHDDELAMLLVLPNQRDGLAALEKQLEALDLNALAERMQMESVQVLLPKFKIDFECSLRHTLEQLGITTIFSKASNFKNMLRNNTTEPLIISDILHKVCLEVNESGTEGASSVAYKPIVISNSIDSRKKFFRADHPFYFAIRSREATYFVGHITKF
nr:serine protease inhibitor 42Dd [Bactrocera oleae]XP_014086680.1 serine protease inhibitor 42Dd [Bactrocera oleae]XP_036215796.1 serine protease inhibitor 42Dd [Bactrocera oleae]XP_036215797.1 serine protease inhibitor 42Dd [Bactrocera oleae]XP_036215798.1 serine protease inhibitor 42Dd [Bactrocera oleae]XP_036215799.1 serine protease inhibitor 42Dd [Bactrocera oleae]